MSSASHKSDGAALRSERVDGLPTATVIKADGTQQIIWKSMK